MDKYGDWFIMALAGALLLIWSYRSFYRWLHAPVNMNRITLGKGGAISDQDENVQLLERSGYEVLSAKHVVPIPVELDGAPLGTGARMYIDYVATKDELTYVVKTARDRKPMDWTASGVRDRLLVYALLLHDCSGILYVDAKEGTIRKVVFHLSD
ncbi:hypothetical protein RB620_16545 [Paenibacillus sp. LHD-117]|uniref:hypothetical protein n=1 Tax=Paenibacillus sp. LHD-117 TaxID=3071412 RepID=UPI0027E0182C|nr:hypothetical protein [Paenibacillus sp. LHD-117]MDQ6421038.1 hypothetical protein [Paenibacillus sp. LHD-117]